MLYIAKSAYSQAVIYHESEIFLVFLNSLESQVSGYYDSGAELYRWAEMTDKDGEHHHNEPDTKAYSEVVMESAL